ncbi:hypothetical protein [Agromyces sp. NBRC 114283]|uniref:hypothetical protein n=1 Tax=Agromyces sp. NBRC 114283 TaxID=2994521 RepID=UPI0024A5582C|nr:hypothetical protein [Agromyces sp. NBRC 114283]GLU91310.1 hypothetical protein Agsp01_35650 [Agromyces sp. NBRC 114283]
MSTIDLLRAAAQKLEALRDASTPGPWELRGHEIVRDSEGLPVIQALWVADIDPVAQDAELIVALHRTIETQLAILREALVIVTPSAPGAVVSYDAGPRSKVGLALALAGAILGRNS